MIVIGPKQINDLEALVNLNDFDVSHYQAAVQPQGGPPQLIPMTASEKRAKLVNILNAINGKVGFDIGFGIPPQSIIVRLKAAAFTAFGATGKDTIKATEMPAMRNLYIEFMFDTLSKANFGDAGSAQGKRDKFSGQLTELLKILSLIGSDSDADLAALGDVIKKHGNGSTGEDSIQKKITEITEKYKAVAQQQEALKDPLLGPKIEEYSHARDEFIRLHAELRHALETGMPEDQLAERGEYKRLQEIAGLNTKVQAEAAKTARTSDLYTSFFADEEKKRTSALGLLLKERDLLVANERDFSSKLSTVSPEDEAQISNIRAYQRLIGEELEILQVKIDYLEHVQEEEKAATDEVYLFSKLNALWMADEKSESSKKANHGWKDAFQSAYQAMTGRELSDVEFLDLKGKLKDYNHELQVIVEAADFRTKPLQEKYEAVSAVNRKHQDIIGGPFTEHLLVMGVRKFGETESVGLKNLPKLKSAKYLNAKIEVLKQEQRQAEVLANAFIIADPLARVANGASSSSSAPKAPVYNQGFSRTGELKIQLITQKNDDVKVGKINNEKDNLIGLLVKGSDKNLNFVLPDDANPGAFDSLKTTHKFSTDTEQKAIKGLAEYTPLLEMLPKDQIVRLANFMGPDFARTFNVENEEHRSDLQGELKGKLGNSGLTMGDLLLVALGYRFRSPEFLLELNELRRHGFVFNTEQVNKGADFFADEVTLKQNDKFEGEKVEPQKRRAVLNRQPQDGTAIAKLNSRDARAELEGFVQEILPKIDQAAHALEDLLEAAEGAIFDVEYVKHFAKLEELQGLVPREHPQSSLIEFLMTNPDVYSPEGKKQLATHFAASVAKQYEIQMLNKGFDKLLADIKQATEAKIEAKRKLEEQANADEEREREIAAIRIEIKTTMLGDPGANELDPQTRMLDAFALMEYERRHGGPKQTVVQKAEAQVGNLGNQIQQIQQRIEVVRVVGNEQDLNLLREDLRALRVEKDRLELELAALRNLQQQRLEAAQITPEQIYAQTHDVDAMLRHAALHRHMDRLDGVTLANYVKNAEKGKGQTAIAKFREANEKIAAYNSSAETRRQRWGW